MAAILGFVFAIILYGIALYNKGADAYFDIDSIIIVLGGILSSVFIAFPLKRIFSAINYATKIFKNEKKISEDLIFEVLKASIITRKGSFIALQDHLEDFNHPFLAKGLNLIIEGFSPENIRDILETDIENYQERLRKNEDFFRFIGKLSPAFGMIGTLIGLIAMLRNLTEASPAAIGPAMATALITTFYGAMISYLLCTPIAEKISEIIDCEILEAEIAIEGVLMVYDGLNPRIIEKKLNSFLPEEDRRDFYSEIRRLVK